MNATHSFSLVGYNQNLHKCTKFCPHFTLNLVRQTVCRSRRCSFSTGRPSAAKRGQLQIPVNWIILDPVWVYSLNLTDTAGYLMLDLSYLSRLSLSVSGKDDMYDDIISPANLITISRASNDETSIFLQRIAPCVKPWDSYTIITYKISHLTKSQRKSIFLAFRDAYHPSWMH